QPPAVLLLGEALEQHLRQLIVDRQRLRRVVVVGGTLEGVVLAVPVPDGQVDDELVALLHLRAGARLQDLVRGRGGGVAGGEGHRGLGAHLAGDLHPRGTVSCRRRLGAAGGGEEEQRHGGNSGQSAAHGFSSGTYGQIRVTLPDAEYARGKPTQSDVPSRSHSGDQLVHPLVDA